MLRQIQTLMSWAGNFQAFRYPPVIVAIAGGIILMLIAGALQGITGGFEALNALSLIPRFCWILH
ncbi:MAG: hypothetical protein GY896_13150 [Gammaproteobacteria bacterium]|nr:hypothetical protein [Gammaproteobacteria bacterium]